jgi:inositol transporter-like SP family MFS transporter
VRVGLSLWSFFVPVLTSTGFNTLAWILTGFLVASTLVGLMGAPRNEGKSLEQLEQEHTQRRSRNLPMNGDAAKRPAISG